MNIFDAIREDHDRQRALLGNIEETEGDGPNRRDWFARLKMELAEHAAAEEKHFYSPLMQHDAMLEKARHGVAEHKELDDRVEALDEIDYGSPAWLKDFKELKHRVLHHLEEEEREFFQVAGKALDEGEKTRLAEAYRGEMSERRASA